MPLFLTKSEYSSAYLFQSIHHANEKHAQIAVIYDKSGLFHRDDISKGMEFYQSKNPNWKEKGVKAVLVVNKRKEVYEHQFD